MTITLKSGQTASATGTSTSLAPSLPSAPTAGDFLGIEVSNNVGVAVSSYSSTGNTVTVATSLQYGSAQTGFDAEIAYIANCSTAQSVSETITNPNSDLLATWLQEYAGVATSSPLDTHSSSLSMSPGSITPATAGELFLAAVRNGYAPSAPGTMTDLGVETDADAAYLINSGSSAVNPTFGGTALYPVSVMAAFKPASGTAITAALTASAVVAATNTKAVALTGPLTASVAVAGTNTETVALTAPLAASVAVAAANTEKVALTCAITAGAVVSATLTPQGSVVITATSVVSAQNTEAVALTCSITASTVVAPTNTQSVALSTAVSGSAAVATSNHQATALNASISGSSSVVVSADHKAVALTVAVSASASVTAINSGNFPLTAAITAFAVVTAANGEFFVPQIQGIATLYAFLPSAQVTCLPNTATLTAALPTANVTAT